MNAQVEASEAAALAVEAAMRAGAGEAEATALIEERTLAQAMGNAVSRVEQSRGRLIYGRVFVAGRRASISVTNWEPAYIRHAVEVAVAQAKNIAPDPLSGLPQGARPLNASSLGIDCADVRDREPQANIDEALELESAVREAGAKTNGSKVSSSIRIVALANSHGFAGAYSATRGSRSTSCIAMQGERKCIGVYGTAARSFESMESLPDVASKAAIRAARMTAARKPDSMRVPVIFERDVAAAVLSDVFAAANAANVAMGNSWLADKIGNQVGSELVTLIDDGTIPGMLGTLPFDAEGSPSQRTTVMERGTLRTFLFDTYYARKLGARSTGNAGTGCVVPTNFYLEPGQASLEQLVGGVRRGVLVMDIIGFAREHAGGMYSRGARGFYIENGEPAYPLEQFTIAARWADMLAAIDGVADDLRFDAPVVSPSFRVAEMTIGGA